MIVFALMSLLMFLIAILLYRLDKRQLISSKIAVAAGYIVIAYFMGLGSVASIRIINSFIVMSMLIFLAVTLLFTFIAAKKGVFQQFQKKANYQKICILVGFYIWLVLLLTAYFPGILNPSTSHEIKALLGGILLYLVWNALSYFLHILIFPKHIIREFPSYILVTDLYDSKQSIQVAKRIYDLYQRTAIIMIGTSESSQQLYQEAKRELDSTTAIIKYFYNGCC